MVVVDVRRRMVVVVVVMMMVMMMMMTEVVMVGVGTSEMRMLSLLLRPPTRRVSWIGVS